MKPIEERLDVNFMQALRCVSHRLPTRQGLKKAGFVHALGLRYGLLGAAAAHELFLSCEAGEEHQVQTMLHSWPAMVQEHIRIAVIPKLHFQPNADFPVLVARLSYHVMQVYLSMYRRLCPLDWALAIAKDIYVEEHASKACEGWYLWSRRKALKAFKDSADDSVRFAAAFFERRQADLDELPEIALLGE